MREGLYLVPIIGSGRDHTDPRRAKYMNEYAESHDSRANEFSEVALVFAAMTDLNHAIVSAQADVLAFPDLKQMDEPIGTLKAFDVEFLLKQMELPVEILGRGVTYRTLVKYVDQAIQFSQRAVHVYDAKALRENPKQDFGSLTRVERDKLALVFEEYNLDRKALSNTSTLADLTAAAGEAGTDRALYFGGAEL